MSRASSRRHLNQMPEPPQLVHFDAALLWVPSDWSVRGDSSHLHSLHPQSLSSSHYPELVTTDEAIDVDQPTNRQPWFYMLFFCQCLLLLLLNKTLWYLNSSTLVLHPIPSETHSLRLGGVNHPGASWWSQQNHILLKKQRLNPEATKAVTLHSWLRRNSVLINYEQNLWQIQQTNGNESESSPAIWIKVSLQFYSDQMVRSILHEFM